MKTLLRSLAIFTITLLPALSETKKEHAHEAVAASQPLTDDSEKLAAKQIDKSISDLKEALDGLRDSRKKGERNAFALYKQQAIDALNALSKQASLVINTEAATQANEIKSGKFPSATATPEATVKPTPMATPEATATPEMTPTPEATPTPQ